MKFFSLLLLVLLGVVGQIRAQIYSNPRALIVTTWRGDVAEPWAPVTTPCGDPFPDGALVQVIRDGGDSLISSPDINGNPTGDDAVATLSLTPFAINGVSRLSVPGAFAADFALILFGEVVTNGVNYVGGAGRYFYLRAWNTDDPASAEFYAQTPLIDAAPLISAVVADLFTSWTAFSADGATAPCGLVIQPLGNDLLLAWRSVPGSSSYSVYGDTTMSTDPGVFIFEAQTTDTFLTIVNGFSAPRKLFIVKADYP